MKTLSLILGCALVVTGWTGGAYASAGDAAGAFFPAQLKQLKKQVPAPTTPKGKNTHAEHKNNP